MINACMTKFYLSYKYNLNINGILITLICNLCQRRDKWLLYQFLLEWNGVCRYKRIYLYTYIDIYICFCKCYLCRIRCTRTIYLKYVSLEYANRERKNYHFATRHQIAQAEFLSIIKNV